FVVYKPPTANRSEAKFYYADADHSNFKLSSLSIDNKATAVGATLQSFYEHNKASLRVSLLGIGLATPLPLRLYPRRRHGGHFVFAYSDDSPTKKADSHRGHAKGVVLFDNDTIFSGTYSYPETGMKFGQTILCITLPTGSLGDVGDHLRYIQATPYFTNLPDHFRLSFPVLLNIVKKKSLSRADTKFAKIAQLNTVRGLPLISFAKHKKFGKDLWFDLVAPELGANLAVESWLNGGADDLDSICTKRTSVYDVTSVTLPDVSFNSTRDHSKWAVADEADGGKSYVCIGDMNRQVRIVHPIFFTIRSCVFIG
ncbi:unnamed protein product, partial [Nippostrongylus brasiliensis]|uniref:Cell-death-related nuclease 7 (inferred by orthology to a C. elegans protein) n=1 Tax=Nippostrongylus brasiliensis TaxID=27835 RepID=A0A0N4Y5Y9_NIPBR